MRRRSKGAANISGACFLLYLIPSVIASVGYLAAHPGGEPDHGRLPEWGELLDGLGWDVKFDNQRRQRQSEAQYDIHGFLPARRQSLINRDPLLQEADDRPDSSDGSQKDDKITQWHFLNSFR